MDKTDQGITMLLQTLNVTSDDKRYARLMQKLQSITGPPAAEAFVVVIERDVPTCLYLVAGDLLVQIWVVLDEVLAGEDVVGLRTVRLDILEVSCTLLGDDQLWTFGLRDFVEKVEIRFSAVPNFAGIDTEGFVRALTRRAWSNAQV